MVDKFGISVGLTRGADRKDEIEEDLDMNLNRIVNLKYPEKNNDASTKTYVKQTLKKLEEGMHRTTREGIKSLQKQLAGKADISDCINTNGGRIRVDLDMQGNAIRNLPEGTQADEPVTKGWYAKNWQELAANMQTRMGALEEKVKTRLDDLDEKMKSPSRSKRDLEIENVVESAKVAIEAIHEKIARHHPSPLVSTADKGIVEITFPHP